MRMSSNRMKYDRERNARYLSNLRADLLNFVHGEKKVITPIKKFVSLKLLKFE